MIPYADLLFFGLSLYVLIPSIALGVTGHLSWKWVFVATVFMSTLQLFLASPGDETGRALRVAVAAGFLVWQWVVAVCFLHWRRRGRTAGVWVAVLACLLPLLVVKFTPHATLRGVLAFLGLSYVSFRAVDVVLAIHDGLAKEVPFVAYLTYVFFFPTLSSGPIDRWRRFRSDLEARPTRAEYLALLDRAVAALFQGLLYKFILAALVQKYWLGPLTTRHGILSTISYMYAYSAYLFFDFAGYSAFAISFSCAMGVRTPANFNKPFLAANIADFWARWHISLSTFLRDQIYMRFLLANAKHGWIASRNSASAVGLLLTFGAMGFWHGTAARYIIYGLYHALLMIIHEAWRRTARRAERREGTPVRRFASTLLTLHAASFGFLIFSGRLF